MNSSSDSSKGRSYRGLELEDRKQRRRESLMAAGVELFGSQGYRASSVKMVCEQVGLTERYFYESFANREALLLAVFQQLAKELHECLRESVERPASSADERIENVIGAFFHFVRADKCRARVLMFEILGVSLTVDEHYQTAVRNLAHLIEHPHLNLFQDSVTSTPEGRHVLSIGLVGAILQIAIQWVLENFKTPIDTVIEKGVEIFQAVYQSEHCG